MTLELNLADRISILKSDAMISRIEAVILHYVDYILGDQSATDAKLTWAREAFRNSRSEAERVSLHIIRVPEFITNGSSIDDELLRGVVENAINTHYAKEPD